MKTETWRQLAEHIATIAKSHSVKVTEKVGANGMAYHQERRIRIAPVKGPVSYAIALHELGHLIADNASGPKFKRLTKEIRAWRWARENAAIWTDRMDAEMQRSLRVYLDRGRRRNWPIPDDIFQLIEA